MNSFSLPSKSLSLSDWYDQTVKRACLVLPSSVKGMFLYLPYAWGIWKQIQLYLDSLFEKEGVENVSFPTVLNKRDIEKEKDHIAGFECELFELKTPGSDQWVLRPTSESVFCNYFKQVTNSYKDLPVKVNQWCSVFRVEKNTKAFLRSCEFYWHELHTIHSNANELQIMVKKEVDMYKDTLSHLLNLTFVSGKKSVLEKFAGAKDTYTLETIMPDGQMLQSCTAHNLSVNFSKAFDITFINEKNQKEYVHQSSAGLSTRIIGALIMSHGDDYGLVMPFLVAPIQIMVVDIAKKNQIKGKELTHQLVNTLNCYRTKSIKTQKSFGFVLNEYETKGIPFVLIVGDKEVDTDSVLVYKRNTRDKWTIPVADLCNKLENMINNYQKEMIEKNKQFFSSMIVECTGWDQVLDVINNQKKVAYCPWFDDEENESNLKNLKLGFGIRCVDDSRELTDQTLCTFSGKVANCWAYIARAY